mgnify:FL=1
MSLIKSTAIPPSGATSYEIENSLKFAGGDLSRTPSSAGNRRKWSWSGWVKRAELGTYQTIWAAKTNTASIFWSTGDTLRFEQYNGAGGYNFRRDFNPKMRDPSAWYHMLFIYDSAQGTETDRTQFYLNGVRQTVEYTYDAMPQNFESEWNNTEEHFIGNLGSWNYEGYVAEVHFIDGLVKAPSDFAETGDYGEWKPIDYEGTYGTNGFHLNFTGGGVMSATGGNTITTDGDYKVHTFTSDGTFTPTITGVNKSDVEYLVIAGGGGGGHSDGGSLRGAGGGGAGGYKTGDLSVTSGTGYSITVGDGGTGGSGTYSNAATAGANSVFSSITSTGGGGGKGHTESADNSTGGSGGGGSWSTSRTSGGSASPAGQGNAGGAGGDSHPNHGGGGGGGAGAAGSARSSGTGGAGGVGLASSITGASVTRAGGGGGGGSSTGGAGGSGGGGAGQSGTSNSSTAGTANTGGGGGGAADGSDAGGNGGSGIVIIRYKFN